MNNKNDSRLRLALSIVSGRTIQLTEEELIMLADIPGTYPDTRHMDDPRNYAEHVVYLAITGKLE